MNSPSSALRSVLHPAVILRLLLGWGAYLALILAQPLLTGHLPAAALTALLTGIIVVILVCASGVVEQAEHLAQRLGDPYGTLVLTLSVVLIEVILISAVMLGPGEHASIARDSVMAVSMIILDLVIGACLIVGGARHGGLRPNRAGVSAYLTLLIVLAATAFALPGLIGDDGAYTGAQAVLVAAMTIVLYAYFLQRQMGPQRADFQEPGAPSDPELPAAAASSAAITDVLRAQRAEIMLRALVLVAAVVPIVLLSHHMAALLDEALARLQAPAELSGLVIAAIVFLPETITALRAALAGEMQRVSNLCHGALVSTVGVTIPAVLVIGLLTEQDVVLAASPAHLVLLGISLLLSVTTFFGGRVTALHGAGHVMVFVLYVMTLFA
ncbi:calcium:proton antiporter [Kocuria sp. p3-SID1433]|uniref:calcium:proton antiporter n=1 Tax=unclassified Kocuria TaxID=2649579 RepID=UPI0021A88B07|nr:MULTISPECIES: calcium:proton antiporter [unclassified Kocuria]MCT1602858.1 calcium:proton antiporter [Kocuria sp. p3-SID1428]MCT2180820.1 calcium:proton antiporter [Kocuria sp. p3-SID1433]